MSRLNKNREDDMAMTELEVLAHVDRGMLYLAVWDIPTEVLAERMHVSAQSILISCANRGIPIPDEGYWLKVAAGAQPARPPLTDHRPGPRGTSGTPEDALKGNSDEPDAEDLVTVIDRTLGVGTVELIRNSAHAIVIDPDAELRPHLKWQRDVCKSEASLNKWLENNTTSWRCLWSDASPSSVPRICAILEAMGRAAERLGGTYDENGFDVFGEHVSVGVCEHLGKYRKGQVPSRTYNGLLSLYVGRNVYKDYRKKTLERDVPMAFANVCVNAAQLAKSRLDAHEEFIRAKARYAQRQTEIALENKRRQEFNREVDHYEQTLALAEAHEEAEKLRRYADALAQAGAADEALWVRAKADWADPVTHADDAVFGTEHTADGLAPKRLQSLEFDIKEPVEEVPFGLPDNGPSPTLAAFKELLRQAQAQEATSE